MINNDRDDSEGSEYIEPPQWAVEMLEMLDDLLDESEKKLLTKGADSLASELQLLQLKKEWERYIDEMM